MYVDVMKPQADIVEGFEYKPMRGLGVERVRVVKNESDSISSDCVVIEHTMNDRHTFPVWKQDIPKLIKALQAAQKHLGIPDID